MILTHNDSRDDDDDDDDGDADKLHRWKRNVKWLRSTAWVREGWKMVEDHFK